MQPQIGPDIANPNAEVNAIGAQHGAEGAGVAAAAEIVLVKNSNEHVEEMLIEMFGPEDQTEAIKLLKRIKMGDEGAFTMLSLA